MKLIVKYYLINCLIFFKYLKKHRNTLFVQIKPPVRDNWATDNWAPVNWATDNWATDNWATRATIPFKDQPSLSRSYNL